MSIEVDWRAATSGPDGEALAERIRSFIHDKFQQVALPRFIRSVQVHSFDFGTIAPDLEIKDLCEPFADFYEEDEDDDAISDTSEELVSAHEDGSSWGRTHSEFLDSRDELARTNQRLRDPFGEPPPSGLRSPMDHLNPHFLPRAGTPGIPVGTSTLGYHLMSLGALSGTQTPLAAVAGGTPFANNWATEPTASHLSNRQTGSGDVDSSNPPTSRPSTSSTHPPSHSHRNSNPGSHNSDSSTSNPAAEPDHETSPMRLPPRMRERRPEDFQVLCHAKYAGDIRISLTAEILLDYPMPSFAGLPLKLNVTGLTFDGVAVIAYIRRRIHFCFLSAEDADALIGSELTHQDPTRSSSSTGRQQQQQQQQQPTSPKRQSGGLLQEIRVESEIGRKEDGKQVLKNVGKVERFVLAQVRRIFEEELVFPSFWTFLI